MLSTPHTLPFHSLDHISLQRYTKLCLGNLQQKNHHLPSCYLLRHKQWLLTHWNWYIWNKDNFLEELILTESFLLQYFQMCNVCRAFAAIYNVYGLIHLHLSFVWLICNFFLFVVVVFFRCCKMYQISTRLSRSAYKNRKRIIFTISSKSFDD